MKDYVDVEPAVCGVTVEELKQRVDSLVSTAGCSEDVTDIFDDMQLMFNDGALDTQTYIGFVAKISPFLGG